MLSPWPIWSIASALIALGASAALAAELRVDADFRGGNIIVEKIDGDVVLLRQDLRDTRPFWFYWCFRVTGAGDRTIRFRFTAGDVFGPRGPAVSPDGGRTWHWLGAEKVTENSFAHTFSRDVPETRFAFAIPFLEENLREFLKTYGDTSRSEDSQKNPPHPALSREGRGSLEQRLVVDTLTRTPKGRAVELIRAGRLDGRARWHVLLTAGHHSCEMLANYVLEGLLSAVLAEDDVGKWFRDNAEITVIPFMDKDGVEDGDQGKQRLPYDHWLDYLGESRYASTRALRQRYESEPQPRVDIALDLHCPAMRDQQIYFAFGRDPRVAAGSLRLSELLKEQHRRPLRHNPSHNMPYGQGWNVAKTYEGRKSFHLWAEELPGIRAAATLEVPYATVMGAEVNPESARHLGRDLAQALRQYFEELPAR